MEFQFVLMVLCFGGTMQVATAWPAMMPMMAPPDPGVSSGLDKPFPMPRGLADPIPPTSDHHPFSPLSPMPVMPQDEPPMAPPIPWSNSNPFAPFRAKPRMASPSTLFPPSIFHPPPSHNDMPAITVQYNVTYAFSPGGWEVLDVAAVNATFVPSLLDKMEPNGDPNRPGDAPPPEHSFPMGNSRMRQFFRPPQPGA